MLLWGQKYYGISWSQHPTSFQCSVSLRKSKLYPATWVSTMPSWSCVLFTISLISLQLSQVPFSRNHDIQWHDCLKCTHMCIHTHLYLSYKQNLWVERKMICKWYVHITSFWISDPWFQRKRYGAQLIWELMPFLNSQAWKGLKQKVREEWVIHRCTQIRVGMPPPTAPPPHSQRPL